MKIALFSNTDWYLYNFRRNLIDELVSLGHEVVLIAPRGKYLEEMSGPSVSTRQLSLARSGFGVISALQATARLRQILLEEKVDLLHNFTLRCVAFGSIAARFSGRPSVVNAVTGLGFIFINSGIKTKLARFGFALVLRLFATDGKTLVIVQNSDDRTTLRSLKLLSKLEPVLIPGSGVNVEEFRPSIDKLQKVISVLFIGRLVIDKGIVDFIEASKLSKSYQDETTWIVAGERDFGNPNSVSNDSWDQWAKLDNVKFLGQVAEMADVIAAADIVVLPSYREGLPRSLLEAAASGKPIVATDVPGCRDICRHNKNGILVSPRNPIALADAVKMLVVDRGMRIRFGRSGRALVEDEYESSIIVSKTLEQYRKLVNM